MSKIIAWIAKVNKDTPTVMHLIQTTEQKMHLTCIPQPGSGL